MTQVVTFVEVTRNTVSFNSVRRGGLLTTASMYAWFACFSSSIAPQPVSRITGVRGELLLTVRKQQSTDLPHRRELPIPGVPPIRRGTPILP